MGKYLPRRMECLSTDAMEPCATSMGICMYVFTCDAPLPVRVGLLRQEGVPGDEGDGEEGLANQRVGTQGLWLHPGRARVVVGGGGGRMRGYTNV